MNNKTNYISFWLSQAVSELGSMMTSYALIIWAYQQSRSVMQVSLLTFFTFAPKAVTSFFIGGFVDRHDKKKIIMLTDTASALCSLIVCVLLYTQRMNFYYIYIINIVLGIMEAVQSVLIYTNVREDMQGRVFAVNNAMKFAVIPMGILLGDALSEYLFEPFVNSGTKFSSMIVQLLGF